MTFGSGAMTLDQCAQLCRVTGCEAIQYDCGRDCWLLPSGVGCASMLPTTCGSSIYTPYSSNPSQTDYEMGADKMVVYSSTTCETDDCGSVVQENLGHLLLHTLWSTFSWFHRVPAISSSLVTDRVLFPGLFGHARSGHSILPVLLGPHELPEHPSQFRGRRDELC